MTAAAYSFKIRLMLHKAQTFCLFLLGLGLPLHGALTVFAPEPWRWWKEIVLIILCGLLCVPLVHYVRQSDGLKACVKRLSKQPVFWALLFLFWGLFLVLINQDLHTALVAFRYLGLGFFAMVLGYWLWKTSLFSGKNGYTKSLQLFHNFCTGLWLGVFLSTAFGVWAKFAGGHEVLQHWYSNTISSWVPGQTLPLYHQVGNFVRLQGTSSGPVEYSHLAVLALWYSWFCVGGYAQKWRLAFGVTSLMLIFGIIQSGSRAALLGALILALAYWYQYLKPYLKVKPFTWTADKGAALLLVVIVMAGMLKFTLSETILGSNSFLNNNIVRISDGDHLSRPIQAFNKALERPILGSLGELGPAARAKNLAESDNDQAMIAESVPFDIAAQLGFVGLGLWGLCLFFLFKTVGEPLRILLIAFTPLMLLATIFDMAPLSISFFMILGLGLAWPKVKAASIKDHQTVFNLKRLAFKRYVEAVWGWKDAAQKQFVAQELAQGGIYLLELDNQTIATYCLLPETDHTKVFSFYVHPAYQSLGLGRFILNTLVNAKELRLLVLKVNSSAHDFYLSQGFKVDGEDEYHYHLSRVT